jgi:CRP-like cAMP-binding protein
MKFHEIRISKDDLIYSEGDSEENPIFFFIEQGSVDIFMDSLKGGKKEVILTTLNSGDYFGELSLFTQDDRKESCRST